VTSGNDGVRTALVTGSSRGIGAAIAVALAADGFRVAVNYRRDREGAERTVAAIRSAGGEATAWQADVSRRVDVEAMFSAVEREYGFVGHLVNNAGVTRDAALMLMTDDQWDEVLNTNLRATYLCAQRAVRGLLQLGGGAITNIASPSGIRGQAGQCNYSASKGGVIALTRALAREVGRYRVRVNAVVPGLIATDLSDSYIASSAAIPLKEIPLRRLGTPEDIAPLVVFLGSDGARYITAQLIAVDGGLL
jgi:3-oxoacyl-[acyl-carrier protein] reductase